MVKVMVTNVGTEHGDTWGRMWGHIQHLSPKTVSIVPASGTTIRIEIIIINGKTFTVPKNDLKKRERVRMSKDLVVFSLTQKKVGVSGRFEHMTAQVNQCLRSSRPSTAAVGHLFGKRPHFLLHGKSEPTV
jgi:hypothetical protein